MKYLSEFYKGFFKENPVFILALGMCPTLAVSTSVENAIGMGIAASFVLVSSNLLVSWLRNLIPSRVRIPCFIVIIASFVCIVEMIMQGFTPDLYRALGLFVPLIVVNCIILGRAEAFASKRPVLFSLLDGLGMGIGFTLALLLLAVIRESLGSNKLMGLLLIPGFNPATIMILPPGGFLTLGVLLGFFNWLSRKRKT